MSSTSYYRVPCQVVGAGGTDVGRRRDHNEDTIVVRPELGLFVVADGAGGHNAGDVASKLVGMSIENYFEATASDAEREPELNRFGMETRAIRLSRAVHKANRDVREVAKSDSHRAGMGSTVVVLSFEAQWNRLYLAHVGDSRCYRLRATQIEQLTNDHSLLNDLLETRPDTEENLLAKLPPNVVTRAIGMDDSLRVDVRSLSIEVGDRFLLCSDGLCREIPESAILGAMRSGDPPARVVEQLIFFANEASGADNISAVVVDVVKASSDTVVQRMRKPIVGSGLYESVTSFVAAMAEKAEKNSPCPHCGQTGPSDFVFCPHCGQPRNK